MTKNNSFKKRVRSYSRERGISYTAAREELSRNSTVREEDNALSLPSVNVTGITGGVASGKTTVMWDMVHRDVKAGIPVVVYVLRS